MRTIVLIVILNNWISHIFREICLHHYTTEMKRYCTFLNRRHFLSLHVFIHMFIEIFNAHMHNSNAQFNVRLLNFRYTFHMERNHLFSWVRLIDRCSYSLTSALVSYYLKNWKQSTLRNLKALKGLVRYFTSGTIEL